VTIENRKTVLFCPPCSGSLDNRYDNREPLAVEKDNRAVTPGCERQPTPLTAVATMAKSNKSKRPAKPPKPYEGLA
jgi:hypothetical protein